MFNREEISRAVDMQERSYLLLQWMAEAVTKGFIDFRTAHEYSSLPEAATEWILEHYLNIPENARVRKSDISEFSALFSTYLENSFDLIEDPGKQLYSPDNHCFCPLCSWLVDAPSLNTKKPTSSDKRKARKLKIAALHQLAISHEINVDDAEIEKLVDDPELREPVSLVAYACDLLQRLKGVAVGPAVLVLWRGFAWTKEGSPKQKLKLSADMILEGELRLKEFVLKCATN
ncbi:MAG: hypothetical protein QNJ78_11085 [Gammaproteobacteria bacterium]|nr:hypothetical protein [Gammaproteobacteria bacterium]